MSDVPPPPPGQPQPTPYQYGPDPVESKGFFGKLFDLEFRTFITPSIVKIIYILSIALAGLYGLFMLVVALASVGETPALGLLFLILAPVLFILAVVYVRVGLEVIMTLFRIADNTEALRDDRRGS